MPLKNKRIGTDKFYMENLIEEIDFNETLERKVALFVEHLEGKESKPKIVKAGTFLKRYTADVDFSDTPEFRECYRLVLLILSLNDLDLTVDQQRKIQPIKSLLRFYGLKSCQDLKSFEKSQAAGVQTSPQVEEYIKFISIVTRRIEIRIPGNIYNPDRRINKVLHFLRPPEAFYIDRQRKRYYLDKLDLDNSRRDWIKNSEIVMMEMDLNYTLHKQSPTRYYLTNDRAMLVYKNCAWIFSLCINLICLITYSLGESEYQNRGDRKLQAIT